MEIEGGKNVGCFLVLWKPLLVRLFFCGVRIVQCLFNLLITSFGALVRNTKMFCCLVREKE